MKKKEIIHTLPKADIEYTFLFPPRKILVLTLIGKLPNGRYQFWCRGFGQPESQSFKIDMNENRFSFLYAKNRSELYPDKDIKSERERRIQKERKKEEFERKKKLEELAKREARMETLVNILTALPEQTKSRILKDYNLNIEEICRILKVYNKPVERGETYLKIESPSEQVIQFNNDLIKLCELFKIKLSDYVEM